MQDYSNDELKLMYKAIKVYQVNNASFSGGEYDKCSLLLEKLFKYVYNTPQSHTDTE
jgi:hypothetical protein